MVKSPLAVVSSEAAATDPAGPVWSTVYKVPVTSEDPKPVIMLPAEGLKPISPVMAEPGMFETNEPASTTYLAVDPRLTFSSGRAEPVTGAIKVAANKKPENAAGRFRSLAEKDV